MDFYPFIVMYIQGTFVKICKLSIKKLVGGIQAIIVKLCTIFAHFCQFLHLNYTEQGGKLLKSYMQIAFSILTEGIEQMYNTNTAEDHKKTAILISTMLHFLDPEFEYQWHTYDSDYYIVDWILYLACTWMQMALSLDS